MLYRHKILLPVDAVCPAAASLARHRTTLLIGQLENVVYSGRVILCIDWFLTMSVSNWSTDVLTLFNDTVDGLTEAVGVALSLQRTQRQPTD